jgi:Flp pilus assembly protein TadG
MPIGAGRATRDSGQAAVEFAMALPIVVVILLAIVQLAMAMRNELAVGLAAREGARAASVAVDSGGAASSAARRSVRLPIDVATSPGGAGGTVTVTVTYVDPTNVAIIGAFIGPITHRASVTMALEPP